MACETVPAAGRFASGLIDYADCQARTLGENGFQALAATGSPVSLLITVLMTLLFALIGYRLLLGGTTSIREGVLTLVKIGIVVALATGWPAYRTLVYDVAIDAPGQLAAAIGGRAGLGGDLGRRADAVDQQLLLLAVEDATTPAASQPADTPIATRPRADPDATMLNVARVLFLAGGLGGYVATRAVTGVLLALGPLLIAFLLFDATRGLVEGWLRVLVGAALGALATTLVLGMETTLLDPWLASLIRERMGTVSIAAAAGQLLATTLLFAGVSAAAVFAAARVAGGLRLPAIGGGTTSTPSIRQGDIEAGATAATVTAASRAATVGERSRAASVADAVTMLDRRETAMVQAAGGTGAAAARTTVGGVGGGRSRSATELGSATSAGVTARRRSGTRVSASARRRDGRG